MREKDKEMDPEILRYREREREGQEEKHRERERKHKNVRQNMFYGHKTGIIK